MTPKNQNGTRIRPMRVLVGHKTKAETGFRARASMPKPTAIAPGLPVTPEHDLVFNGGHTISDLVFTNFYVGGSDAWQPSDVRSVDQALSKAMSDRNLNNVMCQYYPTGPNRVDLSRLANPRRASAANGVAGRRREPRSHSVPGREAEWLRIHFHRFQLPVA